MPWIELLEIGAQTALLVLVLVGALWLLSIPLGDISIIDMAFSALVAGAIGGAWWLAGAAGGVPGLILLLVMLWALRMTVYLVHRNLGHGEDVRYTRLRRWTEPGWPFHWLALRKVFLLQGAVIWLLTLPEQIAMVTGQQSDIGLLAVIGALIWGLGFFFETVGDYQLSQFKADPQRRGTVLDSGLWRYTRHPNYFGELCQWWGLFVIALSAPWAWMGVIGPLAYSWLVINVTGQATLDKKLSREKPAYAEYMRRTSGLIPRRPRPRQD